MAHYVCGSREWPSIGIVLGPLCSDCCPDAMCPWTCDRHLVACTWSYDQWSHQHSLLYIVIKRRLRRYRWRNVLSRVAWWPFSSVLLWCRPSWIMLGLHLSWACSIASRGFGLLPVPWTVVPAHLYLWLVCICGDNLCRRSEATCAPYCCYIHVDRALVIFGVSHVVIGSLCSNILCGTVEYYLFGVSIPWCQRCPCAGGNGSNIEPGSNVLWPNLNLFAGWLPRLSRYCTYSGHSRCSKWTWYSYW